MKGPIQSVEVSYLLHQTEDPVKVQAAVGDLLGVKSGPETESLEGHFGNEIVRARFHLTGEDAEAAFKGLVSRMPGGMKKEIAAGISAFLDEHSAFFLRLDKQRLVGGSLALSGGDSVRIKVKPRIFMLKGGARQFYLGLLGVG
ncbi:MAG: hypothetical protein KGI38_05095 [Thaumarchaeota archaeon]|nr:hypothetical protein [Nitrososphaerota archaeon]